MAISNNQVAMTDVRARIFPNDSDGAFINLRNHSAAKAVFIGDESVTISNGYKLNSTESVALNVGPGEEVWGVMESEQTGTASYIATQNE
jgi:hypothetical protein